MHVFAVPKSLIKPFDSDTVSVIANFAKLPRREQNMLLGKTAEDATDDVFPSNGDDLLRWHGGGIPPDQDPSLLQHPARATIF